MKWRSSGMKLSRNVIALAAALVVNVLLFVPIFGDQAGSFFSLPIPAVVNTLEYIFIVVLLVTLFLASKVYREK
jgi:choline-glycine betaine transporter